MRHRLWLTVAAVNALAVALVLAAMEPDLVPVHYGVQGEADLFASKWWYLLAGLLPLAELSCHALYARVHKFTPREQANRALEDRTVLLSALFLGAVAWMFVLLAAYGGGRMDVRLGCAIVGGAGVLIVVISNSMAKLRPNHTLGIKLPWTLKDESVWRAVHRFAGYSGTAGGLTVLLGALIGMTGRLWWTLGLFIAGMLLVGGAPTLYAYRLYKRLHPKEDVIK